jgi:hypothetical protein
VLSLFGPSCGSGAQFSGSHVSITGELRSNGNVMLSGSSVAVSGKIVYGGSANIGYGTTSAGVVYNPVAAASGLPWQISDFAPGGIYSKLPGYVAHGDSINISTVNLSPGIHYVAGDVNISNSNPVLTGVTIVATGRINISGSTSLSPALPGLPTLLAGGGSCWATAIQLSGSKVTWTGTIAAPGGGIQISSSEVKGGRVVGGNVQLSGSHITLG